MYVVLVAGVLGLASKVEGDVRSLVRAIESTLDTKSNCIAKTAKYGRNATKRRHCADWFSGQADLGAHEPKFWGDYVGSFATVCAPQSDKLIALMR